MKLMAEPRWVTRRPFGIFVILLVLVTAIGSTLHWHNDWDDQQCQLCHLRHQPGAFGPIEQDFACAVLTERDWSPANPAPELETFFDRFSSRSPPVPIAFTV